jgi:osmoprotectant transport system ATP-binding protein
MPAAVEFRNVSYEIQGRAVLRDLSFIVEPGETLALLGRSGSGKTTALRMVNALLYPSEGMVLVNGRSTRDQDPIALRRGIGYVIQEVGLFPHWTIASNVGLVPRLQEWPPQRIKERVAELLRAIDLPPEEFGARKPGQLSGGQKQRVGVARSLAADPPVLLFDEPFGALDPITRLELQKLFLELRERFRKTALFVTHDVAEALIVGTRVALLDRGRIDWIGPASAFRRAQSPHAREFLACIRIPEFDDGAARG